MPDALEPSLNCRSGEYEAPVSAPGDPPPQSLVKGRPAPELNARIEQIRSYSVEKRQHDEGYIQHEE